PYAGTVTSVLVDVNTQVEAGAALVRLQEPDQEEPGPVSAPIDLSGLTGTPAPGDAPLAPGDAPPAGPDAAPGGTAAPATVLAEGLDQEIHTGLRAYLLGYDLR